MNERTLTCNCLFSQVASCIFRIKFSKKVVVSRGTCRLCWLYFNLYDFTKVARPQPLVPTNSNILPFLIPPPTPIWILESVHFRMRTYNPTQRSRDVCDPIVGICLVSIAMCVPYPAPVSGWLELATNIFFWAYDYNLVLRPWGRGRLKSSAAATWEQSAVCFYIWSLFL